MRQLLFAFIFLFSIAIISCSDSGTGPNNEGTTTYSIAVDISPSEAGSISPSAEDDYEEGEEIELQANPNDGYVFTEWTGGIESTDNPHSLTVDQDYNITANFKIKSYELTINKEGEGSVNERIVQQKSTEYEHGTVVELTAEPQEGYEFVEWQGDLSGTQNPSQITVDNPKNITAVFEVATYPLSIDVSGEGSVTVTPDQDEYKYGTEVELLAEPSSSDWEFESWDGDTTSTTNPITISIDSTINVVSKFTHVIFAGGNGTEDNPFQISTVEQLQAINQYLDSHFIQINDIDASVTQNWNNGNGFKPIGDEVIKFTGTYNGQSYKIQNLTIKRGDQNNIGLFAYIEGEEVLINNVYLEMIDYLGKGSMGALVGINSGSKIYNSHVSGEILGNEGGIGGLVGTNSAPLLRRNSEIFNSSANVNIKIDNRSGSVGGLVGSSYFSSIDSSHAAGDINVDGGGSIGGLVGSNAVTSIENSYSIGRVEAVNATMVGGLIGKESDSKIKNSFATGSITGSNETGGLLGRSNRSEINNSYSTGNVISDDNVVGGLVGMNYGGSIINSYANNNVKGKESVGGLVGINTEGASINYAYSVGQIDGINDVGSLIGTNGADISSSYWDTESTNQSSAVGRGNADGTTGLTTAEMTGPSSEDNMTDFDWTEIWVTTDNYPALFWE